MSDQFLTIDKKKCDNDPIQQYSSLLPEGDNVYALILLSTTAFFYILIIIFILIIKLETLNSHKNKWYCN